MQKKEECIMKKLNCIFAFALAVCLLLSLTACGNDEPTKEVNNLPEGVSYGIKVVNENGEAIVGALVSMCQDVEGGTCFMPVKTDESGMAHFNANMIPVQNHMKVRVLAAEGYELPLDESGDIRYTPIPDGEVYIVLVLKQA
jgi:hypothetical protein